MPIKGLEKREGFGERKRTFPQKVFYSPQVPLSLYKSLLVSQCGDAGEGFAFEEFQRGTAAGGDVGHLGSQTALVDGSNAVAAADACKSSLFFLNYK